MYIQLMCDFVTTFQYPKHTVTSIENNEVRKENINSF